jgi:hypothetical protein
VKIDAITYGSHNPYVENHRVSRLRENLTSGSEGEGLETDQKAPRQSFTRQLFFKWIKQHLRIKKFFGISETAVKTQIWIAISVYVLVAIMKKRLKLEQSLYTILQILSITLFEKTLIAWAFTENNYKNKITTGHIQLNLFNS